MRSATLANLLILALFGMACSSPAANSISETASAREAGKELSDLRANIKKIEPFFVVMSKPNRYDWAATHTEPGQTFDEYLDSNPVKPTSERRKIYVLPLGTFTAKQRKIVETTARYLGVFYDMPVESMAAKSLQASYPNIRHNRFTKTRQIRTGMILNDILKPILPPDAAALIALTADDLYPDESMNYVFGQASLEDRVGVWSLSRMDDNTDDRNFLVRTLKIAAHETGHMFSMRHCTKYECVMSGTNHLGETDRRPLDACPECTAKICWLSNTDQRARYEKLAELVKAADLNTEASHFLRKARAIAAP